MERGENMIREAESSMQRPKMSEAKEVEMEKSEERTRNGVE